MLPNKLLRVIALPLLVTCASLPACGKMPGSGSKTPADASLAIVKEGGKSIPVIVAENASPSAREAAEHLCELIGVMSGTRPELIAGSPENPPESAIWIGYQPRLSELFPGHSLELQQPEEIYMASNGKHLAIFGRDKIIDGKETEFGTSHAVYTFLQKQLGIRWFWPGSLGEEIPKQKTVSVPAFEFRFHPVFRQRTIGHYPKVMSGREGNRRWVEVLQRARGSLVIDVGHGFTSWWERYHEKYPDIFALHGPGNRTPVEKPTTVKLCDSNPMVPKLWLNDAAKALKADASIFSISATPNDSGGWCLCEACKAWDNLDGPPSDYPWDGQMIKHVALTDRMVRLWNELGRGLKKIAPDREVYVGALAYSRYRTPPVEQVLDDNIIVGYVGSFPFATAERIKHEKEQYMKWAEQARLMMYRPNLFWYTGGPWGLPNIIPGQTAKDFRFLAENHCIGLFVDSLFFNWSTTGPQNYLIAQMAYDPMADGQQIMEDYYTRAFGPAASEVTAYFDLMAKALQDFMAWKDFFPSGGIAHSATAIFPESFSPKLLDEAEAHLKKASDKAAKIPGAYRERVAFLHAGLDFTRLQLKIMQAMREVRETKGGDKAVIARAQKLIKARQDLLASAPPFAFDADRLANQVRLRKMEDYLGPVADKFLNAEADKAVESAGQPAPSPAMDPAWNRDLD